MAGSLVMLVAAATAFVGTHFVLSHPLRPALVARLGPGGFQAVYSLVALATLAWTIMAFVAAPAGVPAWNGQADLSWLLATAIMLPASILLVGSFQGNPALPSPGAAAAAARAPHGVFHVTRHPMMWAFALWAVSHVLVSPTPRVIVLALAIGILALVGARMQDSKKQALMGAAWAGWEARTSFWPRPGGLARAGALPWIGGIVVWLAASWAHAPLIAIPAGIWRWIG